jgi:hypothetical protein
VIWDETKYYNWNLILYDYFEWNILHCFCQNMEHHIHRFQYKRELYHYHQCNYSIFFFLKLDLNKKTNQSDSIRLCVVDLRFEILIPPPSTIRILFLELFESLESGTSMSSVLIPAVRCLKNGNIWYQKELLFKINKKEGFSFSFDIKITEKRKERIQTDCKEHQVVLVYNLKKSNNRNNEKTFHILSKRKERNSVQKMRKRKDIDLVLPGVNIRSSSPLK